MPENNVKKYPVSPSKGDVAHALIKGGFGAIPLVGAPVSELLGLIVTPPLEGRRIAWLNDMGQRLRDLEEKEGISLESLRNNEAFIDIVLQATQIALRTSQEEKRNALKNAIANSLLQTSPDITLQQIFLNLVDTFTLWHIKILELFSDPRGWSERHGNSFEKVKFTNLESMIERAFPELKGQRDLYHHIWRDLYSNGLVYKGNLNAMLPKKLLKGLIIISPMDKRVTETGEEFIKFISENKEE